MAKTNTGLVEYAKAQLGKPYWYGTFGQTASSQLYAAKKKQYPKYYTATDFSSQYGKRVHDCIGLIKSYLWSDTPTSTPKYKASQDVSANGMLAKCTEKGKIGTMPELPGVLVFMDGHVGVYIGGGYVIEAKGHAYGVVKTALKGRGWTSWGKCPWITYSATSKPVESKPTTTAPKKSIDVIASEVLLGKWGNGDERKKKLESAGYNYAEVQAAVNAKLKGNTPKKYVKGTEVVLNGKELFANSTTKKVSGHKSGKYYIYDGEKVNGRYRITNKASSCGKSPAWLYVTGWIEL